MRVAWAGGRRIGQRAVGKCDTMPHLVGRVKTSQREAAKTPSMGVAWDGSRSGTRKGQLSSQPPLTGVTSPTPLAWD